MKSKLVTVKCDPEYGEKSLDQNDPLMIRLMAALRTKPFAILAGHSGTGKSRMVRKLAYMTCCDKGLRMDEDGKYLDQPGNFCMIQVKPNWHDNTELLGYYSEMKGGYHATDFLRFICKAYAYPDVPFFVCLDEMNLAPVEHYFAEYLSAIESAKLEEAGNRKVQITDPLVPKDKSLYDYPTDLGADTIQAVEWIAAHGLTIPKNLFVVGTVNMDETTCQFSRKVLDRAMTIEMNEVKFDNFGETDPAIDYGLLLKDAPIKVLLAGKSLFYPEKDDKDISKIREYLAKLDDALKGTAFRVAYRFANEYALYARALNKFDEKINNLLETAFDHMVLMKVLPRIADEKSKVYKIFDELEKLEALTKLADSLSLKKIAEIKARNAAYPSFWP